MKRVFISYRRDDAKWQAREIYRSLVQVLPPDHVFMDVDSIPPGADFVQVLEGWVEQCDILLALIGEGWDYAADPRTGQRRLENPHDFVRLELRKALVRGIPVVPVLLDGAPIPDVDRLPDDLKLLTRRSAEFVEHRTVETDVSRLIHRLGLAKVGQVAQEARKKSTATDGKGLIEIAAKVIHGTSDGWFKPGLGKTEWFKDHENGPEMVVVPSGDFIMGSNDEDNEKPPHQVSILKPFAVGRFPVTFSEWDASDLQYKPDDNGYGRGRRPVIKISWDDAKAYAGWLSEKTGKYYRLMSESEWEYCCRAGTITKYSYGDSITKQLAQFGGKKTTEVGSFPSNNWGLHDMHGNVWEWCEDIWSEGYNGAPKDSSARLRGDGTVRVIRGGSWIDSANRLRSSDHAYWNRDSRVRWLGFRIARSI